MPSACHDPRATSARGCPRRAHIKSGQTEIRPQTSTCRDHAAESELHSGPPHTVPSGAPESELVRCRLRILVRVLNSWWILFYPTTSALRKRSKWLSSAKIAVVERTAESFGVLPPPFSDCRVRHHAIV
ncbi:hypothetical protein MRX96_034638 [Rhipicephalus microplus]